ncbi:hypothetical protein L4C34_10325 [Vibrio profundum]|uniref:hypothetical protein n=1 Tax=Vibrio profundum TaxID=2910247 RepID=UPI003D0E6E68
MSFENRIFKSKTTGAINAEGCVAWLDDMKDKVLSSNEGDTTPWVHVTDARGWEGGTSDSWEAIDDITTWIYTHNCIFNASVIDKKMYQWAGETHLNNKYYTVFYDYDEAYQACLHKLAEVHNEQDK